MIWKQKMHSNYILLGKTQEYAPHYIEGIKGEDLK